MFDGNGKLDIRMSFYGDREKCTLELYDHMSGQTFLRIKMTPANFVEMFSGRRSHLRVDTEFFHLERVGKMMEMREFTFKVSENDNFPYHDREKIAAKIGTELAPEGWTPDNYFGSQSSFFRHANGQWYARTTIRRWVDAPDGQRTREPSENGTVVSRSGN